MLIEFSVENFRSIKDRVTLSMVAGSKKENLEDNLIDTGFKDLTLLKSAVIYGPNASGKSNVIRAMFTAIGIIMNSNKVQKDEELPLTPFLLDSTYRNLPTSFEIVFIQNSIRYVYGFSADSSAIHTEYLYYYPQGRKSIIFERDISKGYKFTVDKREQTELSKRTLKNSLYLSTSTQWNYEKTSNVFDWFKKISIINPSFDLGGYTSDLVLKNKKAKRYVELFLKMADIGVEGIKIKKKKLDIVDIKTSPLFSDILKKAIEEEYLRNGKIEALTPQAVHYMDGDEKKQVIFDFDEESDGTKKLFELSGLLYTVLEEGRILFVDELSVRLHPYLVEFIITIFNSRKYNKKGAQLVFTTHNTYLLKQSLFRRDQIWFTEKTKQQSTDLYSLYDIKGVRKEENLEKGYLLGRYGATPFIQFEDVTK